LNKHWLAYPKGNKTTFGLMGSAAVLSNELKNNIAQTCQGTSA